MSTQNEIESPGPTPPQPQSPATGPDGSPSLSPVDQILAAQPQGRSLLDTRPAGQPVPKWMWLLPLLLALPGGLVGWLLIRDSNRSAGRAMLVVGIIVTLLTALSFGSAARLMSSIGL